MRIMTKPASNQLLERSSKHEIHPAGETSPVDPKKSSKAKASTTIVIGWILRAAETLSAALLLTGFLLLVFHPGGLSGHEAGIFPPYFEPASLRVLHFHP